MEAKNKKNIVNFNDSRLVEWHRDYLPLAPINAIKETKTIFITIDLLVALI